MAEGDTEGCGDGTDGVEASEARACVAEEGRATEADASGGRGEVATSHIKLPWSE